MFNNNVNKRRRETRFLGRIFTASLLMRAVNVSLRGGLSNRGTAINECNCVSAYVQQLHVSSGSAAVNRKCVAED